MMSHHTKHKRFTHNKRLWHLIWILVEWIEWGYLTPQVTTSTHITMLKEELESNTFLPDDIKDNWSAVQFSKSIIQYTYTYFFLSLCQGFWVSESADFDPQNPSSLCIILEGFWVSKFADFDPQNPSFCLLSLKDFGGQNPRILGAILAEWWH